MGEADAAFHQWFREAGQICYRNETGSPPIFCWQEEDCYIGMALPFINESTWDWRVRAVLYLVGLLYRSVTMKVLTPSDKAILLCKKVADQFS